MSASNAEHAILTKSIKYAATARHISITSITRAFLRKYGQPPIDTPEETSAIPFKKMKPKNEAYNIPRIEKSDCTIK